MMLMLPLLIADITDMDERAFIEALYREHHGDMFLIAAKYTDTKADAEAVIGDTIIELMKRIDHLRRLEEHVMRLYVCGMTRHVALCKRRAMGEPEAERPRTELPEADAQILERVNIARVAAAISRLSESDQAILEARYFLELSDCDIARELGMKSVLVRFRLMRACRLLYRILKEDK